MGVGTALTREEVRGMRRAEFENFIFSEELDK
jgi:hypothetical protein